MRFYSFLIISSFYTCMSLLSSNPSIAMGADEDVQHTPVAIVGGGLAGLSAALTLEEAGQDYALFEARPRLGGRVYSETVGGTVFNMGGQWIDPEHTNMQKLAKELHMTLKEEPLTGPIYIKVGEREQTLNQSISMLESIVSKIKPVEKEATKGKILPGTSLQQVLPRTLFSDGERSLLHTYLIAEYGLSEDELNAYVVSYLKKELNNFLKLFKCKAMYVPSLVPQLAGAYEYRVQEGMTPMIEAIAHRLTPSRIRTEHELISISKDATGKFHLHFKGEGRGEVVADVVIMTMPFSVLRSFDDLASLGLPDLTTRAIKNLSYGNNTIVRVSGKIKPDLRDYIHGNIGAISSTPVSGPGLSIYTGAEVADSLTQETAFPLVDSVLGDLEAIFSSSSSSSSSSSAPSPTPRFLVKNWKEDPFARGSYSTFGLHGDELNLSSILPDFKGFRQFAEPVGLFMFAGEHTQLEEGYMESAVRSGQMVAEYCLRHPKK